MVNNKFELSFASEIATVGRILQDILRFIDITLPALSVEEKTDIRLIYSELLCNAVIHGNKNDMAKNVHLSIEIHGNAIKSTIADEGCGFDYQKLLSNFIQSDRQETELRFENENGRGIKLVCALTDEFSFNRPGNEIFFYKKVASHGQNFSS